MRIVIEALGIDRPGGVRTSILNTIKAMPQLAPDTYLIVYLSQIEPSLEGQSNLEQRIIRTSNRFFARIKLMGILPFVVHHEHIDLVHFTKNLSTWLITCPQVITVHDLTAYRYPEIQHRIDAFYWHWIEPLIIRRARMVIAVSDDVANDLVKIYKISQSHIRVIKWAVDDRFRSPVDPMEIQRIRKGFNLPEEYILFLGILAKKKNLKTLIRSIDLLRQRGSSFHLVIAGRRYFQSDAIDELRFIQKLGVEKLIKYIGPVSDNDLPPLLAGASAYVLPSLHEGFGIPCWEAMAVGIPVITSRRGALPEIIGEAGILIDDPLDEVSWADAILKVINDIDLRTSLIEQGHLQIGNRTWISVAKETLDVYKQVYESNRFTSCGCDPVKKKFQ